MFGRPKSRLMRKPAPPSAKEAAMRAVALKIEIIYGGSCAEGQGDTNEGQKLYRIAEEYRIDAYA